LLMVCHVVVLAALKRWLWRRHHLRSKRRSKPLSPVGPIGAITIIKLIMRIIMSMARMFFLTKFLKWLLRIICTFDQMLLIKPQINILIPQFIPQQIILHIMQRRLNPTQLFNVLHDLHLLLNLRILGKGTRECFNIIHLWKCSSMIVLALEVKTIITTELIFSVTVPTVWELQTHRFSKLFLIIRTIRFLLAVLVF
jgi:hypothetical protein